jgi:translation initiation factor 3 subunit K
MRDFVLIDFVQSAVLPGGEPDPLIPLLPQLLQLSSLLLTCRFPAFWASFRSDELAPLRDNYTVECLGFEDSVRDVVIRGVKAAFVKIGKDRLSKYLDLQGDSLVFHVLQRRVDKGSPGSDLEKYIIHLGWQLDASTGFVTVPPNPDNQISATVVRENVQLSRKFSAAV